MCFLFHKVCIILVKGKLLVQRKTLAHRGREMTDFYPIVAIVIVKIVVFIHPYKWYSVFVGELQSRDDGI